MHEEKKLPPGLKLRHRKIWVSVKHPEDGWKWIKSPYVVGEEADAAKFRESTQRALAAGNSLGISTGVPTLREYATRWIEDRKRLGIASWDDDKSHLDVHILPALGHMKFEEVRPKQVKDMVAKLRAAKKAPRTVRNVYWTLKAMYRAAQIDDVASPSYTPCILTKNELGKLADAKSNWRTTAKFEREEFEWLISDARIPKDRRVMYALLGLGMLRHGEAAGLRWGNYHQPNGADIKPLGRLVIATSYDTGRTKTRVERWMPVHPVLAAMLAEWRLAGWPREFGRAPGPDDLIVPHTKPMNRGPRVEFGGMRSDHDTYKRHQIDCDALGLRYRRVHDLRRTGITLAREDGADKDLLRFCTHGGPADIMDVYTSLGWSKLCVQVAVIQVKRREGTRGTGAAEPGENTGPA